MIVSSHDYNLAQQSEDIWGLPPLGRARAPWVVLAVDPTAIGFNRAAIISVYLPCVTSDATLSEERWQESILALYQDMAEASSQADKVILLGCSGTCMSQDWPYTSWTDDLSSQMPCTPMIIDMLWSIATAVKISPVSSTITTWRASPQKPGSK